MNDARSEVVEVSTKKSRLAKLKDYPSKSAAGHARSTLFLTGQEVTFDQVMEETVTLASRWRARGCCDATGSKLDILSARSDENPGKPVKVRAVRIHRESSSYPILVFARGELYGSALPGHTTLLCIFSGLVWLSSAGLSKMFFSQLSFTASVGTLFSIVEAKVPNATPRVILFYFDGNLFVVNRIKELISLQASKILCTVLGCCRGSVSFDQGRWLALLHAPILEESEELVHDRRCDYHCCISRQDPYATSGILNSSNLLGTLINDAREKRSFNSPATQGVFDVATNTITYKNLGITLYNKLGLSCTFVDVLESWDELDVVVLLASALSFLKGLQKMDPIPDGR
ncbi:hypothetical protein SELMODRAFT_419023 [Selaginella moellendorffii]|uniref:Uncharacterized protein n=1 Tax=Selaginella moellendorffii TaxID=88036 RepID=D8S7K2_SELML|nr:hypothetical protein SELMODRAFT_419023 [Selaginella moellendorffii]